MTLFLLSKIYRSEIILSDYLQDVCIGCKRLSIPKNKRGRCTGFNFSIGWEEKPIEYCQWRAEIELSLGIRKADATPKRKA